jgi:histidyl-tRNA synthetase
MGAAKHAIRPFFVRTARMDPAFDLAPTGAQPLSAAAMTSPADTRPKARVPRGFLDRRAVPLAVERRILDAVARVYESFGFEALETGAFEYADALGKFLPDADRPNEGVFALQDDDEAWMALRYDLTAPLARFVAQNWEMLAKPFRRYAFGKVWRDEKPGPGRYREFVQCDADTVGSARPEADAEIIAMAAAGYVAAGLSPASYVLKINNRKLLNGLLTAAGVEAAGQKLAVLRAMDKLDRLGLEGVKLLLGEGRRDESGAYTRGAELGTAAIDSVLAFMTAGQGDRAATLDRLASVIGGSAEGEAGLAELSRIGAALGAFGISEDRALFDPSVVRGLEYYTGAVFEAELLTEITDESGEKVQFGSIGGGGRYDDLVARFTGEQAPATGFSFGVSRLAAALEASGASREGDVRGPVVVIAFSEARMADYFALAAELRAAGLAAEVYLGTGGMRAQLRYADRRLSPAAVILGDDEIARGEVTVKDLDRGRELAAGVADNKTWREERPGQVTAPRAELVATVRAIVERPR